MVATVIAHARIIKSNAVLNTVRVGVSSIMDTPTPHVASTSTLPCCFRWTRSFNNPEKIMKIMLIALIILFSVTLIGVRASSKVITYPPLEEVNEIRFLKCIELVENSRGKTGKRGEYGIYQIHPATWKEHSNIPMVMVPESVQRKVALNILRHNAQIIERRGDVVNNYSLAIAWCSGPYAKRISSHACNYAYRVINLYPVTQ
jgi:hypothetical protein